jgi:hypothetical protein
VKPMKDILLGRRHWPLCDSHDLDRVNLDTIVGDDDTEVLDMHLLKLALVVSQVELVFMQALHDYLADVVMFFQGVSEDEDIVQVDNNHPLQDEVVEDLVHHCLEGCGAVCQTEIHHEGFEQAVVCMESCLPFVTLLDADVVYPQWISSFIKYLASLRQWIRSSIRGSGYLFFRVIVLST